MNQQMGADLTVDEVVVELKRRIMKSEKPYDLDAVDRAIQLACKAHEGQKRSSGEDYVCHPLLVACILVDLGMDSETIVASILHDVVEDTPVELADVQKQFGADVAALVDGVTKLNKIPFSTKEEQQAENVRKMLLAMAQDIRVIIIKLADRLHNMRTIGARPPQKQRDKAKETAENAENLLNHNLKNALARTRELESAYRTIALFYKNTESCLLYTSPSPRD